MLDAGYRVQLPETCYKRSFDTVTPKMGADGIVGKIPTRLPYALEEELTLFYVSSQIVLSCTVLACLPETRMYGSALAE